MKLSIPFRFTLNQTRPTTAGVSAQVYVNDPSIRQEAEALFESLKGDGWLLNWYSKEAAAEYGLTGPFDYVLEAGEGYFFADAVKPEFFTPSFAKDGGPFIGKHGHFPGRGDKPPFILSHPSLACRQTCDHSILDIAPTICKVLGISHGPMEGVSLL